MPATFIARSAVVAICLLCLGTQSVSAGEYEAKSIRTALPGRVTESYGYRLLKPAKVEQGKTYPLIVFLHGAGERGDDNKRQLIHFCNMMATPEYQAKYPCFVLAPQCRKNMKWVEVPWGYRTASPLQPEPSAMMSVAIKALKKTVMEEPIDGSRIYLTGLSMGGYGTWDLAARNADWFACAAPICGGGDPLAARKYGKLPIWNHHGDRDGAVPVVRSRVMVEALKKVGANIKYTEYPGVGHNSWTPAYSNKAEDSLLNWMFKQKRDRPADIIKGLGTPAFKGVGALTAPGSRLRADDRIVFFGDSITAAATRNPQGYINVIKDALAKDETGKQVTLINAGISGHKVPNLQGRLDRDVLSKKPTAVLIYIGINDVWHSTRNQGTPKDKYRAGLLDLVDKIRAAGSLVVLATPTVIGEKPDGSNKLDGMLEDYAAITRDVAKARNVVLCDLREAFIAYLKEHNKEGKSKGVLTGDTVHLNAEGNKLVAEHAAEAVARAMWRGR